MRLGNINVSNKRVGNKQDDVSLTGNLVNYLPVKIEVAQDDAKEKVENISV